MNMKLIGLTTALALAASPASAGCWSAEQVKAARVRDMQTMLMVAALRCRAGGHDLLADYNAFVTANRTTLEGVNGVIKARFRAEAGPIAGQTAYDRFTTALANAYGAGAGGGDDCALAAAVSREGAAAATPAALSDLAERTMFGTPVAACPAPVMAEAKPAAPSVLAEAAAPATVTPVLAPAVTLAALTMPALPMR